MNDSLLYSNLRFLAAALAVIGAMALFFLLLSWGIGGTYYFREELLGGRWLFLLAVLIVFGIGARYYLGHRSTALH